MRLAGAFVAIALSLTACGDDDDERRAQASDPYVVVAVDNHFHDIHPEDSIEIDAARALVVENEGRNLHNFTVVGTDINKDLRPGRELRLAPVGDFLEPGTYDVICKYHGYVGMGGRFTVTG